MTQVLFLLGFVGGIFSGLLGLGGAVFMVPLLLFVPPLLGEPALSMKQVAAISIVQVFFASISGVIVHWKHSYVNRRVVLWIGVPAGVASFVGAWLSARTSSTTLLAIFAVISTLAFVMMLVPLPKHEETQENIAFSIPLALLIAVVVGGIGGMIGAPGAFIFVPLLIYILKIPMRITLGSTLVIVLIGSLTGLFGKFGTNQIHWPWAWPLAIGGVLGAQLGGWLSTRTRVQVLRWLLIAIIGISTAKVWLGVV